MNISDTDIQKLNFEESFTFFFEEFVLKLTKDIPITLKMMLKIVYDTILEYYQIEKNNYNPLFTFLIFNFLISPKLQEMNNISPSKYQLVRNMNRLIRNICFNEKFQDCDYLAKYNDLISDCNSKLIKSMDKVTF